MDTTAQQSQNPQTHPQDSSAVQTVQPQPVVPVGQPNKEFGPVATSDVLKPTETAPVISPEVAEHGVEVVKSTETVPLTLEDQKHGVTHAKETMPVHTEPKGMVTLPLTQQQAVATLKTTKSVKESIAWLAVLVLKQLKRMHEKIMSSS